MNIDMLNTVEKPMLRSTFVLRLEGDRARGIAAVQALEVEFRMSGLENFSIWHMEQYLFGYGENGNPDRLKIAFDQLPEDVKLVCAPGTMREMYHDIGIMRRDKSKIRHRVFAARLKPGCAEEYKRRHDALVLARGDELKDHAESNFTIWHGDGHIFGYCELVKAFDHKPTSEEHAATVAWEMRQLEIMDWLTDDMNWLTGEDHPPVERVI